MFSSGNMMKGVLVAIVLVTLTESGLAAEKLATCCETVTKDKITDPILGFLVQSKTVLPCVDAVILQTEKALFCIHPKASWLHSKIVAFRKDKREKAASPSPSPVSLLSMITSSAPPSSSSSS